MQRGDNNGQDENGNSDNVGSDSDEPNSPNPVSAVIDKHDGRYSSDEKSILAHAVWKTANCEGTEFVPNWTPRNIRAFYLKYDLSRLLYESLNAGDRPNPNELVKLLEKHALPGKAPEPAESPESELESIVRQVS